MKREIVWVMGTSAAGKETFMRRAASDDGLAATFGWAGRLVVPCQASLEYIAQFPEDPITAKREQILEQVPQLLEKAGVVLVKWQFADTTANRPEHLQRILPEVVHTAVVLHPPEEELSSRLAEKAWWETYGRPDWTELELPFVVQAIEDLPSTFTIRHLNSGQEGNYEPATAYNHADLSLQTAINPGATGSLNE